MNRDIESLLASGAAGAMTAKDGGSSWFKKPLPGSGTAAMGGSRQ